MPAIDKLLADLNESPPQSPAELEAMLADSGYDIVPSEAEMPLDMAEGMGMEEEMAGEEMMADEMGMEEGMEMAEEMPMMPPEMPPEMPTGTTPRAERMSQTRAAARKALMG